MRSGNLLSVLGVSSKEDVHTNLFSYCLQHSAKFRKRFFESVLSWRADVRLMSVNNQVSLRHIGRLDIIVVGRHGTSDMFAVVEVKIHAAEGTDQTKRYASKDCLQAILAKVNVGRSANRHLIFFSLYPNDQPKNKAFRSVCMRDLLTSLKRKPVDDETTASLLLRDWSECLSEFYDGGILSDGDLLVEKLAHVGAMGSGFLAFENFLGGVGSTALSAGTPWRDNKPGRPYYGIRFHKRAWHPEEVPDVDLGKFNPARHFDIHIEIQFFPLRGVMEFMIHYESNPYCSKLKERLSNRQFTGHWRRRVKFRDALLKKLLPHGFTAAREFSINQIAHIRVPLEGTSVAEARKWVGRMLSTTSQAIDGALADCS